MLISLFVTGNNITESKSEQDKFNKVHKLLLLKILMYPWTYIKFLIIQLRE